MVGVSDKKACKLTNHCMAPNLAKWDSNLHTGRLVGRSIAKRISMPTQAFGQISANIHPAMRMPSNGEFIWISGTTTRNSRPKAVAHQKWISFFSREGCRKRLHDAKFRVSGWVCLLSFLYRNNSHLGHCADSDELVPNTGTSQ